MSRWKAAGIHLSANAVIATLALALIFLVWYPHPYSQAAGAGMLALLLLGVDLVLGPLLTLVVYKTGKKGLRFDLTLIVLLQIAAFAYGMHVVARARPAFIVANIDRLNLVAANDIDAADFAKAARPQFASAPWSGPMLIGARLPTDIAARNRLALAGPGGKDIDVLPQYYTDYTAAVPDLLAHAKSVDALRKAHADQARVVDDWLRGQQLSADQVRCVPLVGRSGALTAMLDSRSGALLDVLAIDPW
ncbi:TfpX/TfpZ family type IV pilin accessory protein [Dokdonella sp.]|uniref:TfpX/TfpZ family type IV pilin accessory protein n=1 Tax=Dokdonella sp. TaxID=2291710 RepID=UPI0027B9841C|nr:TfpX/TfpZ family type IV pilin accessory protein [Dokdonella sp.]